jgi:CelD/BcsL family acetyltransferase involved in cellulose biosynthesis
MTLDVRQVDSLDEFRELGADWNRLAAASTRPTVFARHEWFDAAWQWCCRNGQPRVLCVHRGGALIGLLPLLATRETKYGLPLNVLRFLSVPDAQSCDILVGAADVDAVADALSRHLRTNVRWDVLEIDKLESDARVVGALGPQLRRQRLAAAVAQSSDNPRIALTGTWKDYYATRTRRLKKGNNHLENRLRRDHTLELRWIRGDTAAASQVLGPVVEVSSRSWKKSTGLTLDEPGPNAFITRLTEHAVANGWLSVWQLLLDGRSVAAEYQLVYEGHVYALRSDYDTEFEALSPGTYLNWKLLEQLFNQGLADYNMGPGDNPYKQRWAESGVPLMRMTVYNRTIKGWLLRCIMERVRPALGKRAGASAKQERREEE